MRMEKYDDRHWAVYDAHQELVCVTVYKKGALEVIKRLSEKGGDNYVSGICSSQAPHNSQAAISRG